MRSFPPRLPITSGRVARGRIRPPGSKSVANRYLPLAALAAGTSRIEGLPDGDDVAVMRQGLERLGVGIATDGVGLVVEGLGGGPHADVEVDTVASGTTMRFLAGVAATGSGRVVLDGTERMRERPIGPLIAALRALGVEVEELGAPGYPPIAVRGPIRGGRAVVDGSQSSQFVTALLLAAPMAAGGVEVVLADGRVASRPYLNATLEAMGLFGVESVFEGGSIVVPGGGYRAATVAVPPDASGAVYGWVGAAITRGEVLVEGLARSGTQADLGVLDVLEAMGCTVEERRDGVLVRRPGRLLGVAADLAECPDGALALVAAAAVAEGPSRFDGLATLRVKETDRLAALEAEVRRLGAGATAGPDHIEIVPGALHGGVVRTYDDHRMAMSFSLIGLVVDGVEIDDPACVRKTWPGFFEALGDLALPARPADVIAIDGPAGVGKSTVGSRVAERLGRVRLDTGAFYRAATIVALRGGDPIGPTLADRLEGHRFEYRDGRMHLDGEDVSTAIRGTPVTASVSAVSAVPEVRAVMVAAQRAWVVGSGTPVVVEGRDIGTVVFPDALTKVFLVADPEERARRRAAETGAAVADELTRLLTRDGLDSGREAAPLRPADDAWELDTTVLGVEEVVAAVVGRHQHRVALAEGAGLLSG